MSERPFHCGSQERGWSDRNCENCLKFDGDKSPASNCEIVLALNDAFYGDGTVSPEIALRMGYTDYGQEHNIWPCGEAEWREEGIASEARAFREQVKTH